jgi:hypothetical protein
MLATSCSSAHRLLDEEKDTEWWIAYAVGHGVDRRLFSKESRLWLEYYGNGARSELRQHTVDCRAIRTNIQAALAVVQ